ncbi:hypothetical protein D9758_004078 [Tetrapyrgos nigripes]|uniref:Uncharacterized protein n=1 Tax=Tetrapyrgos nigripes TaxID=182062 RepID=A0A8H5GU79_9AGAR|nr:hypothetical protein D9758_004078 [Tetrapyrgos nigripes]
MIVDSPMTERRLTIRETGTCPNQPLPQASGVSLSPNLDIPRTVVQSLQYLFRPGSPSSGYTSTPISSTTLPSNV